MNRLLFVCWGKEGKFLLTACPKLSIDIILSSVYKLLLTIFVVQISLFSLSQITSVFSLEFELIQSVIGTLSRNSGNDPQAFWYV
jgi:hypothetical protein